MVAKTRKREPLLSPKELENRRYKHPVSTEPATSSEGIPQIPAGPKGTRVGGNTRSRGGNYGE
jgi:hypothetical protein